MKQLTDGQIRDMLRPIRCFLLDMDGTFYLESAD